MQKDVRVAEVKALKTRSGNTRFVLVDEEGSEYTTFKEPIARQAVAAEGRRARIEFHEQERGGFRNVYLDAVEPLGEEEGERAAADSAADEVAWRTAVEAAPYLLSGDAVDEQVPPEQLFETLQPFKELVAEDIREGDEED